MRVVRGSVNAPEPDRTVTIQLVQSVATAGESALRVWQPPEQVAFGRRDANREGFERARDAVTSGGVSAIERSTGGHAVYFTGNTVSFVRATPVSDERTGIERRYEETIPKVRTALSEVGVETHQGEPEGAFCPGTHSLSADGKIVGLAQRVRNDVAVVAGILVLQDHEQIAALLDPVYDALDIPFNPDAVGSVARTGGTARWPAIRDALEAELASGEPKPEPAAASLDGASNVEN